MPRGRGNRLFQRRLPPQLRHAGPALTLAALGLLICLPVKEVIVLVGRTSHRCMTILALACSSLTVPPGVTAQDGGEAELLRLSAEIFHSQIVENDTTLFSRSAVDEFRVLAPGGLIEDRAQVIGGVSSWNAVGIEISGTEVVRHGPVALVLGRIDIDGEMSPIGRWGPLKFMTVFLREDGQWRLLSRSMTPCVDMLIHVGRC